MKSAGPNGTGLVANFVVCISAAIPAIIFVVWSRSTLSVICLAFAGILIAISFVRSGRMSEEEMIQRQDQSMGKTKDDAAEMARWVP